MEAEALIHVPQKLTFCIDRMATFGGRSIKHVQNVKVCKKLVTLHSLRSSKGGGGRRGQFRASISHKQSEVTKPMLILYVFWSISHKQSEVTNPMFILLAFSCISHKQSEGTGPMCISRIFSSILHKQSEVTNPMFISRVFSRISRQQSEVTNPMFILRVF